MRDRQMQLEAAMAAAAGCFPLGNQENAVAELRNGSERPAADHILDVVYAFSDDVRPVLDACATYMVEEALDSGKRSAKEDVLRDWDAGKIEPFDMLELLQ